MMKGLFALSLACVAALGAAAAADPQPQKTRSYSPPPERITTRDGRTWEKIPLRYVDAGYIAALLGGPVLPTEADVWAIKMRGFGGFGGYPGGYGAPGGYGYGGGYGGY